MPRLVTTLRSRRTTFPATASAAISGCDTLGEQQRCREAWLSVQQHDPQRIARAQQPSERARDPRRLPTSQSRVAPNARLGPNLEATNRPDRLYCANVGLG